MTYAVSATKVTTYPNGYVGTRQVPTFYLDPRVQGILGIAQARAVAEDILPDTATVKYHIHIKRIGE